MNQLLNEVKGSGNATFVLVNDLILSSQLEKYINTQVLKTIIDDQKGRERYLPHKKLFLKYRTEGFIDPSNEYEAFKSFIKKSDHKGSLLTDDALNNALQSMHKIFQVQPDFDTVSDLFVDPDYIYSSFQEAAYIEEFFDRIQNSTRLFSLNGYSPNEYGLILRKQNEKNN